MGNHYWIRAGSRRERDAVRAGIDLPPVLAVVDAHRRLRGPYTAAGSLLRLIGRDALERDPELGVRHRIAILTSAPEFRGAVPPIETPLELASAPGERTRFQARLHTLRVAHGLVDFLRDHLAASGDHVRTLVVENAHEADPTDLEFLAVLLRRVSPELLTVVVGTDTRPLTDPPGPVSVSLQQALNAYAERVDEPIATLAADTGAESEVDELALAYVDSDCTSDDPRHRSAYERVSGERRVELHDERLATLLERGEFSVLLGAVPYHAERGSDPAGVGAEVLRKAQVHCRNLGIYHAAADFGARGRKVVDRLTRPQLWWDFTGGMTTALSSAGRAEEAEAAYEEVRGLSTDPVIHMKLAYGTAMLYARHHEDERRDYQVARMWLNLAIAIASTLPDPKERTYFSVFNGNGLALVEIRQGRPKEALRLLEQGMERLERELAPGERVMHRAGLRYNRARLYAMSGQLEQALAEYTEVMAMDDGFADHYFNRGNILRSLGRSAEAIADYEVAIELSPPFPEAHYNCGDARLEIGDVEGALTEFGRVIELDPGHVDARVNRASILCDKGEYEAAWRDVTDGLGLDPDNVHLLCVKGQLLAGRGDGDAARDALAAAIHNDQNFAQAWAIRGGLAHDAGDLAGAISDLSRALDLDDSAAIRFNRAVTYEAAGRFTDAVADYEAVLAVTEDVDARRRRDSCLLRTADTGTEAERAAV